MSAEETTLTEAELRAMALSDEERQPCEVWTRVMGYHRPVVSFNRGKQSEFTERVCFIEPVELPN